MQDNRDNQGAPPQPDAGSSATPGSSSQGQSTPQHPSFFACPANVNGAASHGSGTSQSHADMRTLLGLLPSALAQQQPSSSSFNAAQQLGGSTQGTSQGSSGWATPGTPTNGIPGFSSLLSFLPTGHAAPGFNAGQPVTPGASNSNLGSLLSLLSPGQSSAPTAVPSTSHGAFGTQQPASVPCPNDPAGLLASLMAMAAPQQPAVATPTSPNAFMNLLSSSVQPADVSSILEGFANQQQQQQQVQQSRDNGLSALMAMLGGGGSGVAMAGAMNAGGRLLPFEFKNSRGRPPKQRKTILKRLGSNLASMLQAAAVQTAGVPFLMPAPAMAQAPAPAQQEPSTSVSMPHPRSCRVCFMEESDAVLSCGHYLCQACHSTLMGQNNPVCPSKDCGIGLDDNNLIVFRSLS